VESSGQPKRAVSAVAQEETTVFKLGPEAYRTAMGAESALSPRKGMAEEEEGNMTDLLPEVQRKVQALAQSPFFQGAPQRTLVLLATNLQEVELRYGDVFVGPGQALHACFLIAEGHLRLSAPPTEFDSVGMGRVNDVARISGMGRLPEADANPDAKPGIGDMEARSSTPRPKSQGLPSEEGQTAPRRLRNMQATAEPPSLMVQLGKRPPLLPPAKRLTVATTATGGNGRGSRLTPRKPGTPKHGTSYEASFRQTRVAPYSLVSPHPDVELGFLWPGDAFGLGTLLDPRGECPYPSGCEVRVQSCEARVLVLAQRSLLYLADPFARKLVERLQAHKDPVAPSCADLSRRRAMRSKWIVNKKQVLEQTIMFED